MSGIRSIFRGPDITSKGNASAASAPFYVKNTDNRVRVIPAGSGTVESILQEANGAASFETLTAARTLVAADSGKIFYLGVAGGLTATLPLLSAAQGFHATFIVSVAPTTDYVIATNATDVDKMVGGVHSSQATSADTETTVGADQFNFIANSSVIGDRFDIFTDGVAWYGRGFTALTASGTFTG